ncbi:hypothetical protein M3193_02210 [Sporosarcina luteola]|uniref:hypothetical protein n=1 Tax=Sporosarcina luteola TaxID=582850 RepID=UPI00203D8282|nr:hypothetical protein [Sporosarcina luteola]MCM3742946.1 hypothetical protein [Sporosarcina luteola]
MCKKIIIYLLIGVVAVVFLFSEYNEYKEKSLDDLVANAKSISFKIHNDDDRWTTDKKEAIDELTKFLSQYQIKKMKDPKGIVYSEEVGFWLAIHTKDKIIMAALYEERIYIPGMGYYKVLNGPIDKGWLQSFTEKYQSGQSIDATTKQIEISNYKARILKVDTNLEEEHVWHFVPEDVKTMAISVEAENVETILFWISPTGTETWGEGTLIGYDIDGSDGWSITWEFGDRIFLDRIIVQALGSDGVTQAKETLNLRSRHKE